MTKFRATRVRKLFTSLFAKPRGHVNFSSKKGNDRYNNMRKRLRPYINSKEKPEYYDHHEEMCYFGNDNVSVMNDIYSSCHDDHDHHQRVDVNLGEVRGVLEAVNMTRSGRSKRKTSSCPSSIKCSPIHQGFAGGHIGQFCGGESSIQAAIAHCKSSLGQSSDFRFWISPLQCPFNHKARGEFVMNTKNEIYLSGNRSSSLTKWWVECFAFLFSPTVSIKFL